MTSDIEYFGGRHRHTRSIMPLNESVALIVYRMKEKEKVFDVWVMNELVLGAHEKCTWTKQLTLCWEVSGFK